jgi:hypothetical protein
VCKHADAVGCWAVAFLVSMLVMVGVAVVFGVQDIRRSPLRGRTPATGGPANEFRGRLRQWQGRWHRRQLSLARLAFDDGVLALWAPGFVMTVDRADVGVIRFDRGWIWARVTLDPVEGRRSTLCFRTRDQLGVVDALRAHHWPVAEDD